MGKNRVKVMILGSEYVILTEDPEQQIQEMAGEVENQINSFIESSPGLSSSMATVLAALNFCDGKIKAEQSVDNLRVQIKEYLHEAERGRSLSVMAKEASKEAAEEAQRLKDELEGIRKQLNEEAAAVRLQAQQDTEEARAETERMRADADEAKAAVSATLEEMESLKSRMSGEMKDEAEMMNALQAENEQHKERQAVLNAEMERIRKVNFDMEQALAEARQDSAMSRQKIAGETAVIQAQFKKDLDEAKKQVEPLMQEILMLQRQVNQLTERSEESERAAATLRLAMSRQETTFVPEEDDERAPEAPPQGRYFAEEREDETVADTESTTDDLLSFFNLRQG